MEKALAVKGYKVFNPDWSCRGYNYGGVGTTHKMSESDLEICENGFHFCLNLVDCFDYYPFASINKVAEVIGAGKVIRDNTNSICCASELTIVKELSWGDVLILVNKGTGNLSFANSGKGNSGCFNSGNYNSGDDNSGHRNSGHNNTGSFNSGSSNSGDCNSGACNSGHHNSGCSNFGNCNSGSNNSGDFNSGICNSGYNNSGNFNSGEFNSGDWNFGNHNSGVFCTSKNPTIKLFDHESNWTYEDWMNSRAQKILRKVPKEINWRHSTELTDAECKTTGFLLTKKDATSLNTARQQWWDHEITDEDREAVINLPNFNADTFYLCTGIRVE